MRSAATRPQRWTTALAVAAIALALPVARPAAQSLLVESLQSLQEDAETPEDFGELERLARTAHGELQADLDALQALEDASGAYLLYDDAAGVPHSMSDADAHKLAETLALDMVLASDPYEYAMGLLVRSERGGDLDRIVAQSLFAIVALRWRGVDAMEAEDMLPTLIDVMLALLHETDGANRVALARELGDLEATRAAVLAIADEAARQAASRASAQTSGTTPPGFLNEPGYWLVQLSGQGWEKRGAGHATLVTGYENLVIQVTEEVREPTRTQWYWQLPPGFDMAVFERLQQEFGARVQPGELCNLPALGPRNPAPDIWTDGPNYEVVRGPIADWSEVRAAVGNSRLSNNDPAGTRFWHHDSDHTWDDLIPVCRRFGVSIGE